MALGIFAMRVGFDGLCRLVEWDKVALSIFAIRVGFDRLCAVVFFQVCHCRGTKN